MTSSQSTNRLGIIEAFFRLLEENVGISPDISKEYLLSSRLDSLAKDKGFSGYLPFLESLLVSPVDHDHWQAFEAMTTNETMFFRDRFPFEILRDSVIPEILEKKSSSRELNIWCAAASSGQEPYSLAILLKESFPHILDWKINFFATDICDQVLGRAENAIYSDMEVRRGLSDEQIARHFTVLPDGSYQLNSDIKRLIKFSKLNLIKEWLPMPKFDLVLIRNALIYFNKDIKDTVLKRMSSQLSSDGFLLLGASESLLFNPDYITKQYANLRFYKKGSPWNK